MSNFCKNEGCPPSERLLAYQNGDIEGAEARAIGFHLAECEFCEAEADFYSHYPPPSSVTVEPPRMPEPLHQLAEALLRTPNSSHEYALQMEVDNDWDIEQ
ncbi:MAG: hypothetical protein ACR2IH_11865 [Pyrinomonadaceae bacterium]